MFRGRFRPNRSSTGQTTSEFAGVLMVFFLIIFFPMLDLVAMAALFGAGMVLNAESAREASLVANRGSTAAAEHTDVTDATAARETRVKGVETFWSKNGLGQWFNVVQPIQHTITVTTVGTGANPDEYVHVSTVLTGRPFLNIPFPVQVQGLNAPMQFNYSQERLIEQ